MPKRKLPPKMWSYAPRPTPKAGVPDAVKIEVSQRSQKLIDEWKPQYIQPPPEDMRWNCIVDLFTKWHRNYFYFVAKYACPGPTAMSPFFESLFTRLEYVGEDRFNLSFMRHTGKWVEVEQGITLTTALNSIRSDGLYHPS
jgi:hypothetical protein